MTNPVVWGVEFWGPALVARWRTIRDDKGVALLAYEFDKLPEAVTKVPCALSFISEPVDLSYSQGEVNMAIWKGKTHFHLTLDVMKKSWNYVNTFYRKITEAAAGSVTLGGKVESFTLTATNSIGPALLNWGNVDDHFGLVAYWEVVENLTGKIDVGV